MSSSQVMEPVLEELPPDAPSGSSGESLELRMDSILAAIHSIGKAVVHNQLEQEHINRKFEQFLMSPSDIPVRSNGKSPSVSDAQIARKVIPPIRETPIQTSCWRLPLSRTTAQEGGQDSGSRFRLDPPRFDGTDPDGSIFRAEYYFDCYGATDAERLRYSVPLFDPPAAEWIRYYCRNNHQVTWPEFLEAVRHRFDPGYYQNYVGALANLKQTGSVIEYQNAFESLLNHVVGVPDFVLVALYIAGLKPPLHKEVNLKQPQSLAEAFALAGELAECRIDTPPPVQQPRRTWGGREQRGFSSPVLPAPNQTPVTSTPSAGSAPTTRGHQPNNPPVTSNYPVVRVSSAEKADRSRRGLCWYCDEKWAPNHVCKRKMLVFMGDDEDDDDVIQPVLHPEDPTAVITADVSSVLSLSGSANQRALRITGTVGTKQVQVLIDAGATHNFIRPKLAEQLCLTLTAINPFRVYVENGESLICSHMCPATPLMLQGNLFEVDIHVATDNSSGDDRLHRHDHGFHLGWEESAAAG